MTQITSMTVRVTCQRLSLVDDEIYFKDFDAMTTDPVIYNTFAKMLKDDPNIEKVQTKVITVL